MNTLKKALQEYVTLRRTLGFKFQEEERTLKHFVSFMEDRDAHCITTQLALEWATKPTHSRPAHQARRLGYVRGFAHHLRATQPSTQIPPPELLPARLTRAQPYLYTQQEIRRLMAGAKELSPHNGLPGLSYYCLFGLLAATGLRIGEALALTRGDVDLDEGVLTIHGAKFGKSPWCHSILQRATCSLGTSANAMPSSANRTVPIFWSPNTADGCGVPLFASRSISSRVK